METKETDIEKIIEDRIKEVVTEIQSLAVNKEAYKKTIKEIDIRIAQLVGGLEELNKLKQSDEKQKD